jgi:hypothetical protein
MIVCQWHLDIRYGRQGEALAVIRASGAEKFAGSEFRRHSDALASFVVPRSQHWVVYRVLEEPPG